MKDCVYKLLGAPCNDATDCAFLGNDGVTFENLATALQDPRWTPELMNALVVNAGRVRCLRSRQIDAYVADELKRRGRLSPA